jgi:hypothetical protein
MAFSWPNPSIASVAVGKMRLHSKLKRRAPWCISSPARRMSSAYSSQNPGPTMDGF